MVSNSIYINLKQLLVGLVVIGPKFVRKNHGSNHRFGGGWNHLIPEPTLELDYTDCDNATIFTCFL